MKIAGSISEIAYRCKPGKRQTSAAYCNLGVWYLTR